MTLSYSLTPSLSTVSREILIVYLGTLSPTPGIPAHERQVSHFIPLRLSKGSAQTRYWRDHPTLSPNCPCHGVTKFLGSPHAADSFLISTTLRSLRAVRAVRARSRCAASSSDTGGWLATALLVRAALARFSWMRRVRSSWRFSPTSVYSSVMAVLAWPAILLVSMLLPPTSCRHVMLARRRECGPKPGKSRPRSSLGAPSALDRPRRLLERLPDAGVPSGRAEILVLREDPIVRSLASEARDPLLVPLGQAAQRQRALALGGLGHVDIAPAVALLDPDDALVQIDVLDHQAGDFGDARPGVEARLADQEVWLLQPRQDLRRLLRREDALLEDLPLLGELDPLDRVRVRARDDLPLRGLCDDSAHGVAEAAHRVPGRAFLLEPVHDLLGFEILEARVLPPGQHVGRGTSGT